MITHYDDNGKVMFYSFGDSLDEVEAALDSDQNDRESRLSGR